MVGHNSFSFDCSMCGGQTVSLEFCARAKSVALHAAGPVFLHLLRRGHFQWTHDAETDPLRVREAPNAFGQLRILHFPRPIRTAARSAATHARLVIPGTA